MQCNSMFAELICKFRGLRCPMAQRGPMTMIMNIQVIVFSNIVWEDMQLYVNKLERHRHQVPFSGWNLPVIVFWPSDRWYPKIFRNVWVLFGNFWKSLCCLCYLWMPSVIFRNFALGKPKKKLKTFPESKPFRLVGK